MKVKILDAMSTSRLEKKVNNFIAREYPNVIDIQLSAGFGSYAALIKYEN
ncbi:hypothetical protein SAMN05216238_107170 [Lentibacillus persicus]|uniref:Uncharacterized protein n=1 Tax=Lentibacillus persicus TaxID=640948 RepID=A0A1I1XAK2_9BACI|nr:hypothetical protein [Lentibacillus persicus]SFE04181.1 hypothetical protein SAMN05216238_107170 [Lentibacillus persicus]